MASTQERDLPAFVHVKATPAMLSVMPTPGYNYGSLVWYCKAHSLIPANAISDVAQLHFTATKTTPTSITGKTQRQVALSLEVS